MKCWYCFLYPIRNFITIKQDQQVDSEVNSWQIFCLFGFFLGGDGGLAAELSQFYKNCPDVVEFSRFILLISYIVHVSVFPFCQ